MNNKKYNWRIAIAAIIIAIAGLMTGCSKEDPKPCVRYVTRNRMPDAQLPAPPVVLNPNPQRP